MDLWKRLSAPKPLPMSRGRTHNWLTKCYDCDIYEVKGILWILMKLSVEILMVLFR